MLKQLQLQIINFVLKKLLRNILLQSLFLFIGNSVFSQEDVQAKIVSKKIDNLVDINGVAQNIDATYKDGYTYLLFSLKKGKEGNYSKNTQSGEFSLEPTAEKKLATLKINVQEGEECKVFFFIRKDDELVSKDSLIVYGAEKLEAEKVVSETDIEIKGLVIEDVKTKLGKDFYDYFYQKYMTSGLKYPFIINISEAPSMGRGSKISIDVDDRIIFEFMTRPSDEYIQLAVDQALRYIYSYSAQRKLLYKNKKI